MRYSLQPGRHYRFLAGTAGQWELRSARCGGETGCPSRPPLRPGERAEPEAERGASRWPDVRELTVVVAGGKEYRAFYREKWQARARGIVEAAAAHFEEQFPIRVRVVGFRDWNYKTAPQSAGDAFEWLHQVDRGEADLVIGFTLVPFPGRRGEIRGVTQYFSRCIVIPDGWAHRRDDATWYTSCATCLARFTWPWPIRSCRWALSERPRSFSSARPPSK